VIYGEKKLPENVGKDVFLWEDFLKIGKDISDTIIQEKVSRQKPGECACLIYTSGTTGNPKGCMISHDNLTWCFIPMIKILSEYTPDFP